MITLIKILGSALILAGVNAVAQRNPQLAGWLAGAPLVSLLSVALLFMDRKPPEVMADFLGGVLVGVVPTVGYLALAVFLIRRDVPVVAAIAGAMVLWGAIFFAMRKAGVTGV